MKKVILSALVLLSVSGVALADQSSSISLSDGFTSGGGGGARPPTVNRFSGGGGGARPPSFNSIGGGWGGAEPPK